jgi:hypothetical protein
MTPSGKCKSDNGTACEICNSTGYFAGRVDHVCWASYESLDSGTNSVPLDCWTEGRFIPCPLCKPETYGKVIKVAPSQFGQQQEDGSFFGVLP